MIRILVVDDRGVVRTGFRALLETCPNFELIGEDLRLYAGHVDRACLKAALRPNSDFADEGTPASKYRPTP
jgi:DNA-binding NarL/FixJ family response regulator